LHRQCPNYKDSRWRKCVSDIHHDWDGETTSSAVYSRIYKFSCVYDPVQLVTKHLTSFSDVWGHPKHDFTSSTRRSWCILIYIESEQHPVIADANIRWSRHPICGCAPEIRFRFTFGRRDQNLH
jgi:hypothetical protein